MAIYEIYASGDPEQARFVRDRGAIIALVFPAAWLAWHRLWYALAIYLCVAFFFFAISPTQWATIATLFSFVPGLYLFLEGPNLLAAKYRSAGLHFVDVVEAESLETAELKWFIKQPVSALTRIQPVSGLSGHPLIRPPSGPGIVGPGGDRPDFGLFAEE